MHGSSRWIQANHTNTSADSQPLDGLKKVVLGVSRLAHARSADCRKKGAPRPAHVHSQPVGTRKSQPKTSADCRPVEGPEEVIPRSAPAYTPNRWPQNHPYTDSHPVDGLEKSDRDQHMHAQSMALRKSHEDQCMHTPSTWAHRSRIQRPAQIASQSMAPRKSQQDLRRREPVDGPTNLARNFSVALNRGAARAPIIRKSIAGSMGKASGVTSSWRNSCKRRRMTEHCGIYNKVSKRRVSNLGWLISIR